MGVDIKDKVQREQFKDSGALVKFWYLDAADGNKYIQKAELDASKYNGERYWVVGCIGTKKYADKDTGLSGGLFTFQNFFEQLPETEKEMIGFCTKNVN